MTDRRRRPPQPEPDPLRDLPDPFAGADLPELSPLLRETTPAKRAKARRMLDALAVVEVMALPAVRAVLADRPRLAERLRKAAAGRIRLVAALAALCRALAEQGHSNREMIVSVQIKYYDPE